MRARGGTSRAGARRLPAWAAGPLLALAAGLGSCATSGTEWNLAPVWSQHSRAGGGVEIEALAGALRSRVTYRGAAFEQIAVRPLWIRSRSADGNLVDRFLTPFGYAADRGDETVWQLLPIVRYDRRNLPGGEYDWTFFSLPGIYWSRRADGRTLRGWFPFGGVMERFLSYDRLEWVLFPLWLRTERSGRVTHHVLWPVFSHTHGTGGPSWRVWPLLGNSIYEGRYERWFFLWPVFLWQRNNLALPPSAQETKWMVFPLYGRTTAGNYRATTVLWPFFGWSHEEQKGFSAFDAPWPFVRVMRDPRNDVSRTRIWPFWSTYHGDGLDSSWYGWPIVNARREVYEHGEKDAVNIVPFLQTSQRRDEDAGKSLHHKIWPLYRTEMRGESERMLAFPALNPLWRTPEIDEMYAWIWELYTRERSQEVVRERFWLGLWRREKDAYEDRQALMGLWAQRVWYAPGGKVRDTSILYGLLRWRSGPEAPFELLAPAVPGPGWPLERVPRNATVAGPGP